MSDPLRSTVVAPANIAFVKYWGAHDLESVRPVNRSISMTLRAAVTRTTVDTAPGGDDEIWISGDDGLEPPDELFAERALAHLRRVKRECGCARPLRAVTRNSFPTGAGIASSASGFTALTLAVRSACGAPEVGADWLSRQVRRSGSGSAARSVLGGYVEWPVPRDGGDDADPAAGPIADAVHWPLADVIAIVAAEQKSVSSRDGHRRATTSPHFARRLELLDQRLTTVRRAIIERDLARLGPVIEAEAIELHLIAMSSVPPIFYWQPGTLVVLAAARRLRREGVPVWATMDAGPNVHLICEPPAVATVVAALESLAEVGAILVDGVGDGPRRSEDHLV